MKQYILLITVIILIILIIWSYRKPVIDNDVTYNIESGSSFWNAFLPQKAKKTKNANSREEFCRDVFETLTGKAFPTKRPYFLKNPKTGRNLELDGYCHDLQLAFEHNGKQHYEYPNSFHKTEEEFKEQVERDNVKKQLCKIAGIKLVTIPYDIPKEEINDYVRRKTRKYLKQRNINV